MRIPSWLRPLANRLSHAPARSAPRRRAFRPRVEGLEDRTAPAVFSVTTTADDGPGSLRQAIDDANGASGADTITFALPDSLKEPGLNGSNANWWKIQTA